MKKKILIILVVAVALLGFYIQSQKISVPILMYHDIVLENAEYSTQVTKEKFYTDMVYLSENGYTALLTDDIIKIVNGEKELPEKPVIITFDDGYLSNYEQAFDILKETNMKAIISVTTVNIRDENGNGSPAFMTFEQCRELVESGYVSIENHTHNLHNSELLGAYNYDGPNGIQKWDDETTEEYKARLFADLSLASEKIEQATGIKPRLFAYPYGASQKEAYEVFEKIGIEIAVNTKTKTANLNGNSYELSRYGITMDTDIEKVLK